jgi:sterol desaturase/sphingolipid hydroxylase (fatty acid hydroxylase superfamily)
MDPRYLTAALALALLWTAESLAPMFAPRTRRLSHLGANFALAALNAGLTFSLAFALLSVTTFAHSHHFGVLHLLALPAWISWLLALLLLDCWQYWWHRLNHRLPFLWRFHSVHHADAELDVSSGVRFHTIEVAFSFLARLAVLPLLGLTVPHLLLYEAISLPIILFHHSNLRLPTALDRALRWFIVTPRMHCVHHSRHQPETDSNYASGLSLWDRLFHSFRLRENSEEITLGLDHWETREWRSLPGMLLAPFHKRSPRPRDGKPESEA